MDTLKKRIELYNEYFNILAAYDDDMQDVSVGEINDIAINYAMDPNAAWIDISDGDMIVGFLIVCSNEDEAECHPDADYTIAQAYVSKDHRRKGLMSRAVEDFMYDHPGVYAYDTLKGNEPAEIFWNKLWDRLLLTIRRTYLPEVREDADNIRLHGITVGKLYEKNKKEK